MPSLNPADVLLSTTVMAEILGCSGKKIKEYCDLPSGAPNRLPCTRSELTGNHRKIGLADAARFIAERGLTAAALRLWNHACNKLDLAEEELRCFLICEGIDVKLFPAGKKDIFLVCLPANEAAACEGAYSRDSYRTERFANVHDASLAMGSGIRPALVVIDLGLAGTSAGLNFVQWLIARGDVPAVFAIEPEDGIAATLPATAASVQRPANVVEKILYLLPPVPVGEPPGYAATSA